MPRSLGSAGASPALSAGGQWRVVRRFMPYLWPAGRPGLKMRVVITCGLIALAKAVLVATPFFYSQATDRLAGETAQAVAVPALLLLAYGMARFGAVALAQIRDAIFVKVSMHATRQVALETFGHLHSLSLRFHLERRTGGLSRAIERGVRAIDFLLRFMLFNILPTLLELALVIGIFARKFAAPMVLVLIAGVVAFVGFTALVTEWRTKFRRAMNERDSRANTRAIDSLLNYETVKYFNNEAHEAKRYDQAIAGYQSAAVRSQGSLSFLNAGQALIVNATLAAAMLLAGQGVIAGDLSLGDFVLVNSLLIQLFVPLNLLGFVYREIKQALVDMEQLFGLMDEDREVADRAGARDLAVTGGRIDFRDVWFRYDERRPILKGISFSVPAGRTVAIVGPSGAGKSTIARILYRFYDIDAGQVLIDGQDIRQVTQTSLRRAIGIVPQDTVLFNDTIGYNIAYGRPDAPVERVAEAARLAQIDGFVARLPDGFDTMVGERGLKLSGGEKQRVAIARTIVKDPPILLLDEATSALDTGTEREIQAALDRVAQGRTTLMIAHRLSTVVKADEILVLRDGRIIERGSHEALLAVDGVYAAMWASQQQGTDLAEPVSG
ncbi:MAG: ABCB family ABC transporter ATP-binding protein/permease [Rhodothalassiaceae bacterium]